jgi:hypothetical protein
MMSRAGLFKGALFAGALFGAALQLPPTIERIHNGGADDSLYNEDSQSKIEARRISIQNEVIIAASVAILMQGLNQ